MNKIFFAVILVLLFVQADSSMKWAIGKTLVHSATIIHHLRRIVSMLRQTPKETAVDASIQAVSAGIASSIDRYIDAIENGNEITDGKGTTVKIQNGDESAMAVILLHSIKNDRFVKLFTRC
ncbi:hypothetical protein Ddc_14328 [Ditylenchus destructor]|nr:hypothetical protein Ddc_14328 [Ditylenchus destructor]